MISLVITVLVALVIVGALLWLFKNLPGVSDEIKGLASKAVVVIAAICILFFLLHAFGLLGGHDIPVPQLRG